MAEISTDQIGRALGDLRPPAEVDWEPAGELRRLGGERRARRSRIRAAATGLALAALVAAVAVPVLLTGDSPGRPSTTTAPTGPSPSESTTVPATSVPVTTVPAPTTVPATTPTTLPPAPSLAPYLGLWPFTDYGAVQTWEAAYQAGGHEPWHTDPGQSALSFVQGYLGFSDIDTVVGVTTDSTGAHVAVGFHTSGSATSTAAVVHLVRWGPGTDAPWEVVGTDDTSFTLTTPAYGDGFSTPLVVGGTITGVDESVSVQVRQPSSATPLGSAAGIPAGGTGSPWTQTVGSVDGATDPVLTVVAVTGGHLQAHERFTVTALLANASLAAG